jgi:hypothetical protein
VPCWQEARFRLKEATISALNDVGKAARSDRMASLQMEGAAASAPYYMEQERQNELHGLEPVALIKC